MQTTHSSNLFQNKMFTVTKLCIKVLYVQLWTRKAFEEIFCTFVLDRARASEIEISPVCWLKYSKKGRGTFSSDQAFKVTERSWVGFWHQNSKMRWGKDINRFFLIGNFSLVMTRTRSYGDTARRKTGNNYSTKLFLDWCGCQLNRIKQFWTKSSRKIGGTTFFSAIEKTECWDY